MTRRLLLLLLFALALFGPVAARAQHPAPSTGAGPAGTAAPNPSGPTPAEAQHVIDLLQDPQQRARLIETLQVIVKAVPPASEKPASPPPPAIMLAPDSLGEQLLSQVSSWPERLAGEAALTVQAITDFPMLWRWAGRLVADRGERMAVLNAAWQLALVVGCALLLEWLARVRLARPIAALAAYALNSERGNDAPETAARHANCAWYLVRRLPFALARLALELIPIGVFWGAGSLFAGITPAPLTRFAILVVVNAYAASRIIMAVGRMLVSPANGRLRLLEIGDD